MKKKKKDIYVYVLLDFLFRCLCRWAAVKCFWDTGRQTSSTTAATSYIKRSSPVRKVILNTTISSTTIFFSSHDTCDDCVFISTQCLSCSRLASQAAGQSQVIVTTQRGVRCAALPAGGRRHGTANLRPAGYPKCLRHCKRKRPPALPWQ